MKGELVKHKPTDNASYALFITLFDKAKSILNFKLLYIL